MSPIENADGRLAGYRIVRKLGAGSRAEVFLGSGTDRTVAIKVFHSDVARHDIGVELDALGRLEDLGLGATHFVRLLDVESGEGGLPMLILDRIPRGSVAALLRDRDPIEAGEVVTLLAPLAEALPDLHRLGVAHGRIGAQSLHLGPAGEPVLLGLGHSELFARGGSIAAIDEDPAAARDRKDLAVLVTVLLARVRDAATDRAVLGLIRWIDESPQEFEFCERLQARLFDLADPLPVEFGLGSESPVAPGRTVPARIVPAGVVPTEIISAGVVPRMGLRERHPEREREEDPVVSVEPGIFGRLDALLRENPAEVAKLRVREFARGVRKPFWVAAGAGVLALILAIALVPQGHAVGSPPAPAAATKTTALPTVTPRALPNDPVDALPLLLAQRSECVRSRSVLCLDDVDDETSSAYASDAALIQSLQAGDELPATAELSAPGPTLEELLGASALVRLGPKSNPAAVLMIRTAAGWRIRGYLSGVQATGSPTAGG